MSWEHPFALGFPQAAVLDQGLNARVVQQLMTRFIIGGFVIGQGLDAAGGQIRLPLLQEVRQHLVVAHLG